MKLAEPAEQQAAASQGAGSHGDQAAAATGAASASEAAGEPQPLALEVEDDVAAAGQPAAAGAPAAAARAKAGATQAPAASGASPYAQPRAGEVFRFEVKVAQGSYFSVPTSGLSGGGTATSYDWHIEWGDGTSGDFSGSYNSYGITHYYTSASASDIFEIAISPNGSADNWLASFGFEGAVTNTRGANAPENRAKVHSIVSAFTPSMMGKHDRAWEGTFAGCTSLTTTGPGFSGPEWNNVAVLPDSFGRLMYNGCSSDAFTMHPAFNFPQNVTKIGAYVFSQMFENCSGAAFTMNQVVNLPQSVTDLDGYFAVSMFRNCNGAAFNMNSIFNLPQGVTQFTLGHTGWFAAQMFCNCSGPAFNMNSVFNLPQGITRVEYGFTHRMFFQCKGDAFTMNSVFNMPQGITQVDRQFAEYMFYDCSGAGFQVNSVFKFPRLAQAELDKDGVFLWTFCRVAATQARTASSIINCPDHSGTGNLAPSQARNTFSSSSKAFLDRPALEGAWGNAAPIKITLDANGGTDGSTCELSRVYWGSLASQGRTLPQDGSADAPTLDGMELKGWATAADNTDPDYVLVTDNDEIDAVGDALKNPVSLTLYAVWAPRPVTVPPAPPATGGVTDGGGSGSGSGSGGGGSSAGGNGNAQQAGTGGQAGAQAGSTSAQGSAAASTASQALAQAADAAESRQLASDSSPTDGIAAKGAWSLLSLLLCVLAILSSIGSLLASKLLRRRQQGQRGPLELGLLLAATGVAAIGIAAWLLLDDMLLPMAWVNSNTLLFIVLTALSLGASAAGIVSGLLDRQAGGADAGGAGELQPTA